MRDWKTWAIIALIASLAVVVILLLNQPKPSQDPHGQIYQAEQRARKQIRDSIRRAMDKTAGKYKTDSIRWAKRDSIQTLTISRLRKRAASVDYSTKTDQELDSIINVLYGN